MWRGWIWELLGNGTGFFCFLWCLVLTDFCYTFPKLTLAAKATSKGQLLQWSGFLERSTGCAGPPSLSHLGLPLAGTTYGTERDLRKHLGFATPLTQLFKPQWMGFDSHRWNDAGKLTRLRLVFLATGELGVPSVFVMVLNFSSLVRDSSQDPRDTKRMWEAGVGFQQNVASYLAEFFSWVTFWGVINPWAVHAQISFVV